jgi:nitrile hydratase accessory protein
MINPLTIAVTHDAPRRDDEPVFLTPWEARIFAIVAHLAENATIDWDDFRANLIVQISKDDKPDPACNMDEGTPYYRSWLGATEILLNETAICTAQELEHRIHTLSHHDAAGKPSASGQTPGPVSQE